MFSTMIYRVFVGSFYKNLLGQAFCIFGINDWSISWVRRYVLFFTYYSLYLFMLSNIFISFKDCWSFLKVFWLVCIVKVIDCPWLVITHYLNALKCVFSLSVFIEGYCKLDSNFSLQLVSFMFFSSCVLHFRRNIASHWKKMNISLKESWIYCCISLW